MAAHQEIVPQRAAAVYGQCDDMGQYPGPDEVQQPEQQHGQSAGYQKSDQVGCGVREAPLKQVLLDPLQDKKTGNGLEFHIRSRLGYFGSRKDGA